LATVISAPLPHVRGFPVVRTLNGTRRDVGERLVRLP
jgi:hypothetical protein